MKIKSLILTLCMLGTIPFIQSCDKSTTSDPTPTPDNPTYNTGSVVLEFANMANGHDVDETGVTHYSNALGQNFNITTLRYYVSNVVLVKEDGSEYAVPNVYHIINELSIPSKKITMGSIPGGVYTGIKFMIGVDPNRVAAGNFTGDLDPSNGMYWSDTDGFVAFDMEGTAVGSPTGNYVFKVGGYTGSNNALKTISLTFNGQKLTVDGSRQAQVHIFAEMLDVLRNPVNIDFTAVNSVTTPGTNSTTIANNYADMFSFNHMHN